VLERQSKVCGASHEPWHPVVYGILRKPRRCSTIILSMEVELGGCYCECIDGVDKSSWARRMLLWVHWRCWQVEFRVRENILNWTCWEEDLVSALIVFAGWVRRRRKRIGKTRKCCRLGWANNIFLEYVFLNVYKKRISILQGYLILIKICDIWNCKNKKKYNLRFKNKWK
jgi:hypothetical protein